MSRNVIDSKHLERVAGGKPVPTFPQPALGDRAARGATLRAGFDGVLTPQPGGWRLAGRGHAEGGAQALTAAEGQAGAVTAAVTLPHLTLAMAGDDLTLAADGQASASAATVETPSGQGRGLSAAAQFTQLQVRAGRTLVWSVGITGRASAETLSSGGVQLAHAQVSAGGRLADRAADLRGSVRADGALDGARQKQLADAVAALSPQIAQALRRAAARFTLTAPDVRLTTAGGAAVSIGAPVRLTSASGAVATLSPAPGAPLVRTAPGTASGAFGLTLAGGGLPQASVQAASWRQAAGVTLATLSAQASGDLGPAQAASLRAHGALRLAGGDASFTLAGCEPLSAARLALAGQPATAVSGRLCPAAEPLIRTQAGGWRAAGRFEGVAATLAATQISLSQGAGAFTLAGGRRGGATGAIDLTSLSASDTASARRFNPATAEGRLTLGGETLQGRFQLGAGRHPRLAELTLAHDLATGRGHAELRAGRLAFAKGGLQPVAFSPQAAVARDAEGVVEVSGRFDWTPGGLSSQGDVSTAGLGFTGPLGAVHGLSGTVHFTSLAPLVTAPDQRLTVQAIDAAVPLTDGEATFRLDADGLQLQAVKAKAASGEVSLEPTHIDLAGDGRVEGALLLAHVDLGDILAGSSLADSVKLDMAVDGRLPFTVGADGFRFLQGHITAVRPGRISIARAALTGLSAGGGPGSSTGPAVNAVQDLAYQALENLAFNSLEAEVASRPGGRLGMVFRIKGRFDPPKRQDAFVKLADILNGQAFQKTLPLPSDTPIDLTLDTSLNFDELVAAFAAAWRRDEANSAVVHDQTP